MKPDRDTVAFVAAMAFAVVAMLSPVVTGTEWSSVASGFAVAVAVVGRHGLRA